MSRFSRLAQSCLFACALLGSAATAQDAPTVRIVWPPEGAVIPIGDDPEQVIGVVADSNFRLMPAGTCNGDPRCGHLHLRVDPDGDTCNIPGRTYNSMNSDFGGPLIIARFGHCPQPAGDHVIGILLANDHHQPVLIDGKPITALVNVTTRD